MNYILYFLTHTQALKLEAFIQVIEKEWFLLFIFAAVFVLPAKTKNCD